MDALPLTGFCLSRTYRLVKKGIILLASCSDANFGLQSETLNVDLAFLTTHEKHRKQTRNRIPGHVAGV